MMMIVGMQKKKQFIPLMMEDGYEADGWVSPKPQSLQCPMSSGSV